MHTELCRFKKLLERTGGNVAEIAEIVDVHLRLMSLRLASEDSFDKTAK